MQNVLFILLIIFLTFSFNYICRSYSIFLDNRESSKHKNFIPSNKVPLTGGVIFFFGILFLSHNNFNLNIKIFGALLLIIGLLSDTLFMKSWFSRIFLQLIILVFYVFISNNIVLETRVVILDSFLKNYYFRIFFCVFCYLVLINGTNFIDGLNSLVVGYFLLIITILKVISYYFEFAIVSNLELVIFLLLILFLFNIKQKLFLGDGGSYVLSFIIGSMLINFYKQNSISPYYIVLLLWYPAYENLFSICRKIFFNKKPSEADNYHLHHLIYLATKKYKIEFLKLNYNSAASIIILSFNLIIFIIASFFPNSTKINVWLIFFNILIYNIAYLCLYKNFFKKI
jgi:UDP-N-acetylmuramyl pentapeptide phosphotransferase/UDP-N-acetylglucosamine-1-phosphate transferase